jgi:hypothetical protein
MNNSADPSAMHAERKSQMSNDQQDSAWNLECYQFICDLVFALP